MKKRYLNLLIALSACCCLQAQDLKKEYGQLRNKKADEAVLLKQLEKWRKAKPTDPEMFIAYSNLYFSKSQKEIINLDTKPGKEENLALTDSLGNKAGYMYSEITFTDSLIKKAYTFLDEALITNPKRLDIYFGQVYMLEQTENYKQQVTAINNIITKLSAAPGGWLWTDDKPCEDMPGFFTNTIYKYCTTFYKAEQDEAVIEVSETMTKNFPGDIRFYSLAASSYAAQKKYDKAIALYEQAIKIDPKDIVVLHNLAYVYSLVPDREKSIFYYNEILKYGNEEDKKEAGSKIEALKN